MMTKTEIISLTLDELLDKFTQSPESFEHTDTINVAYLSADLNSEFILWQTKIISGDDLIEDPTSQQRTIVVYYNSKEGYIKIYLYNNTGIGHYAIAPGSKYDAVVESKKFFKRFGKNARKFNRLKKMITEYKENKEAHEFLKKMSTTFPALLDQFILGK